jgi:hypothetical protein
MNPEILRGIDILLTEFKQFAESSLNPTDVTDKESLGFCRVALALCVAAESNYESLRDAYDRDDQTMTAWYCRNLLEIAIYLLYSLQSKAKAKEVSDDRLIDALDIVQTLKKMEAELNPTVPESELDASVQVCLRLLADEGITRRKYRHVRELAIDVNLRSEYDRMNKFTSKFVHPTASSIFDAGRGNLYFPYATKIFYLYGARYFRRAFYALKAHVESNGLKHKA